MKEKRTIFPWSSPLPSLSSPSSVTSIAMIEEVDDYRRRRSFFYDSLSLTSSVTVIEEGDAKEERGDLSSSIIVIGKRSTRKREIHLPWLVWSGRRTKKEAISLPSSIDDSKDSIIKEEVHPLPSLLPSLKICNWGGGRWKTDDMILLPWLPRSRRNWGGGEEGGPSFLDQNEWGGRCNKEGIHMFLIIASLARKWFLLKEDNKEGRHPSLRHLRIAAACETQWIKSLVMSKRGVSGNIWASGSSIGHNIVRAQRWVGMIPH